MSRRSSILIVAGVVSVGAVLLSASVLAAEASIVRDVSTVQREVSIPTLSKVHPEDYTGWVRLFVTESTARWKDYNNNPYHFGFLDFALDSAITLPDQSRFHRVAYWDCTSAGWSGVTENNVTVIAAVYNSEPHLAYSDPPTGAPFSAYYTDATAAAQPGTADSNNTDPSSSHTVFVLEASTTTCPNCPTTNYWLHKTYTSGDVNFHYATMVLNKNALASSWMNSMYNVYWVPTCYADGGDEILIGGYSPQTPYRNMINACGVRSVPDVGVIVSVDWLGGCGIRIDVAISHGTPVNTLPDDPPQPSGPGSPVEDTTYDYTVSGSDPEGDPLRYRWDWGDGDTSEWLGPYDAGVPCTLSHSWAELGTYDVRVQCRDPWYESGWSAPLTATVICCITRGDADGDGSINVGDPTYLTDYLFFEGPAPPCQDPDGSYPEGDADGDGSINVGDPTYLTDYLFFDGPAPPPCE